mmetsp:Transcript_1588/g.2113  ORF Transcript_1588/g.2113 Transcript_1588/m.2113 type:complete len:87 (+) Transcript_1588:80-340(+)
MDGVLWNQTYCVFSLYLLRLIQFLMLIEIFAKCVFLFALLASDDVFNSVFFNGPENLGEYCKDPETILGLQYTIVGYYLLNMLPML